MNFNINQNKITLNFDLNSEIEIFKYLSSENQEKIKQNIEKTIFESFIETADQDYLMARALAQTGLQRNFYWAAAQTIEKYFKAFLLMNGVGVKNFKPHSIEILYKEACKIDHDFINLNIYPHQNIHVDASFIKYVEKFKIKDFIKHLEKFGSADNRYNTIGFDFNNGHLYALDSLSFHLRKKINISSIYQSFNYLDTSLLVFFKKQNPWFQFDSKQEIINIPSEEYNFVDASEVTKWKYLVINQEQSNCRISLDWLEMKMKLPKKL